MSISSNQSQSERFKEAARELECDDDEAQFEAKLKRVAKAKPRDDENKK